MPRPRLSAYARLVRCARCHDHKFDAIPQTDYYAFLGFFSGAGLGEEIALFG
ncbi:MAG: DUF1549 domain-containing protein [Pirellulales bacterium]